MPSEKKMKKCRACGKEVMVEDEQNIEFVHECGWSESRARAEALKRRLIAEIEREVEEEEKKSKVKDRAKSVFGW